MGHSISLRTTLLAGLLLLAACSDNDNNGPAVDPTPPIPDLGAEVTLGGGAIVGQDSERAATWEWLGIPYAAPPVGELRWKAPRDVADWEDALETRAFGADCPQIDFFGLYVGEEDCLTLNVWRPQNQERDLPVMAWIHGGSNDFTATSWPVYNGARLAEQANIVVVSIEYRQGLLGWLYYPPLQDGDGETQADDNSGNFGTLDIIKGMQWIQDNIGVFGGDPGMVTLAGSSAGAANVLSLMLSERANGLFHRAILQSPGRQVVSTDSSTTAASRLLDNLTALQGVTPDALSDAERARYLRDASAEDIIVNSPVSTPAILGDGHVLPVAGHDLFGTGEFPGKVPLLLGTNKDEFKIWTNPLGLNAFPDASNELRAALGRHVSDLWRAQNVDEFATRLRSLDDFPDIYVYRFNWGSPDEDGNSPLPFPFGATGGALHFGELPFMLGNYDTFLVDELSGLFYTEDNAASREAISTVMVDYWGSFIRQGDPNGGSQPAWAPWSNTEGEPRAITLDINYADNSPDISEDFEAWTVAGVLARVYAEVEEPLLSELLLQLAAWLASE
jgi:para-nitrobenzyl esterase